LRTWIDRVGACDLSELLHDHARGTLSAPSFDDPALSLVPFSATIKPPTTEPAPPRQRQPDRCYEPAFQSPAELLMPGCLADLQAWLLLVADDLHTMRDHPDERVRPDPFIRGQDCFVPAARGCVWDLRRRGVVEPLDFLAALHGRLDWQYAQLRVPDWPDARLFSYLRDGVRFETPDLPLQIALFPHLVSFPPGFVSLQKEVRRLSDVGGQAWFELFSSMPYLPIRAIPHGATPRKLEPDRWRSTTDAGAPRRLLLDSTGTAVPSLNEWSKRFDHPKECKDAPCDFGLDGTILHSIADPLGLPVLSFDDDVKDYYHHLPLSSEVWWYSTLLTLAVPSDPVELRGSVSTATTQHVEREAVPPREPLLFAAEYVLGFGHFIASNVAQRLSILIVHLLELEVKERDCMSLALDSEGKALAWLQARRDALGSEHARLHTTKMYTDDEASMVVGIPSFICHLRAHRHVTSRLGLIMAIPAKRQAGAAIEWLGVVFVASLGLLFIPRSKWLRSLHALQQAASGLLDLSELRSLNGLLEHLRGILRGTRSWMHGLWTPFKGDFNPNQRFAPDASQLRRLVAWQRRLSEQLGSSLLTLLPHSAVPAWGVRDLLLFIHPDAARAHRAVDRRGLGVYCHGFFVHFALPSLAMALMPIGILELLATILGILTFACYAVYAAGVVLETDSLSSAFTLTDESAHTELGQLSLELLHNAPEFVAICDRLAVRHLLGTCNAMGDAASRNDRDRLTGLAAQLNVRLREEGVPPSFHHVFDTVFARAQALAAEAQHPRPLTMVETARDVSQPHNDLGDGPLSLVARALAAGRAAPVPAGAPSRPSASRGLSATTHPVASSLLLRRARTWRCGGT
jgi:hypothetical protein